MGKRGGKAGGGGDSATAEIDTAALDKAAQQIPRDIESGVADALRRLGDDFVAEARRKVRAGPGSGKYGTRSRDQIAASISADVQGGALRLTSDGSRLPADRRAFAAAYSLTRWVHPVFGTRARVTQRGQPYWAPRSYTAAAEKLLTDAGQNAFDKADK